MTFHGPSHATLPKKEEKPMSLQIDDNCIACGSCVNTCPVGAIVEAGETYKIVDDECTECCACVDSCPVSAIINR
ncbi:MAG: 4Fe-4S dicluster domain-containing protein [Desulfuromonadales bacterium]